jgi:hypothetical protein
MIDICTVVFQEELDVLKLQARSIELYAHDVGVIRVITNDDCVVDPAWWGKLSNQVEIINRSLFGSTWCDNGWVSQQALKILGCAVSTNAWTMILDAKTIITNSQNVFDAQGRPQVGVLEIYPVFEPSRQIINQLFAIDLQQQLGPGGVPFFINNAQARDMITDIESRTDTDFAEWFQTQGLVTEFMLYTGYLQSKNLINSLYDKSTGVIKPCNVCHSEVAVWDQKFKNMKQATTVSVHRNAWSQLNSIQQQQYRDFLKLRGIE